MAAHLEKLRRDAAECQLISELAGDPKKRDLFARLADHLRVLAFEIEKELADAPSAGAASASGKPGPG